MQERKTCASHATVLSLNCNDNTCQKCIDIACAVDKHNAEFKDEVEDAKKLIKAAIEKAKNHISQACPIRTSDVRD